MVAPTITFGPGMTLGAGITVGTPGGGGGPAPGDITITLTEFIYPSGGPVPQNFESTSTSITANGFIIADPTKSGLLMAGLTAPNLAFVAANLPDSSPGNNLSLIHI